MGRWKFGEEVSDERCVDGRLPKSHVALSLAASRNEDELPVSDAFLSAIDDPEFWRVQFVVRKVDRENRCLDFLKIWSWVVIGACFEAVHQVVSVDLSAPTELGDAFESGIYLLNAAELLLKLSGIAGH
jgi:hypothetical protein